MLRYIITRLCTGIFVLFVVITLTFFMSRIVPSDPAQRWVGLHATPEQKAEAIRELGLDKPIYDQYVTFMKQLTQGDLGISIVSHRPVIEELKSLNIDNITPMQAMQILHNLHKKAFE